MCHGKSTSHSGKESSIWGLQLGVSRAESRSSSLSLVRPSKLWKRGTESSRAYTFSCLLPPSFFPSLSLSLSLSPRLALSISVPLSVSMSRPRAVCYPYWFGRKWTTLRYAIDSLFYSWRNQCLSQFKNDKESTKRIWLSGRDKHDSRYF